MLKRIALIPLGLALGLALLEGGLQVTAWAVQKIARSQLPMAWLTGNLRVLCLGDSNTYGLWLERSEAYPQQLEALWNATVDSPKLEVLNLGFPGTNSSRLVRDLPRLLDTFEPDVLLVTIGVNDFWTLPFPVDEVEAPAVEKNFLERHSLVYRLSYLIRRGRDARELEIEMDPMENVWGAKHRARFGDEEFEMDFSMANPGHEGDRSSLLDNLQRLAAIARDRGTKLFLITYASRFRVYALANSAIRMAAWRTDTPLIDPTERFRTLCPERKCPGYLFPDHHPKAPGYRVIAETIVDRLSNSKQE